MNIKEYILSGIVESYVLGLASPEEQAEFERMCQDYPEVKVARETFEVSLENFALANQAAPPQYIRQQVLAELDISGENNGVASPVSKQERVQPAQAARWPLYVAAASVILLIGSLIANWYFYDQYRTYNAQYDALVAQQSQLAKNNEAMQAKLGEYGEIMNLLKDTAISVVKMSGSVAPASPDRAAMATVYWNTRSGDVYVMVNNLPASAADKQYELWAIVDGKPVEAGVFDVNDRSPLVKLKNISRAEVFTITLEKRGGVAAPEGPMYVLGKI